MAMQNSFEVYLDTISDSKDVTGGGSVAAVVGSLSVSLIMKVLDNEHGRDRQSNEEEDIKKSLNNLAGLRTRFTELIEEDTKALQPLIEAYKMPKINEGQKELRNAAIQAGIENAARPQVEIMEMLVQLIDQVQYLVHIEPQGEIVTNMAEGLLFAQSALKVAHIGVITNYQELSDDDRQAERLQYVNQLLNVGTQRATAFHQAVITYLNTNLWPQ